MASRPRSRSRRVSPRPRLALVRPAADDETANSGEVADPTAHLRRLYRAMHEVIRRIPRGRVATYGQVAELAGLPGGARVAAASLKTSQPEDGLPWQRVIGKAGTLRGRIAIHDPVGAAIQRELLVQEGVVLGDTGLVALDRYGWLPTALAPRARRPKPTKPTAASAKRPRRPKRPKRPKRTTRATARSRASVKRPKR